MYEEAAATEDNASDRHSIGLQVMEGYEEDSDRYSNYQEPPAEFFPQSPFEFVWTFGYNPDVRVLNLTIDQNETIIILACAHIVVVYNLQRNLMKYLIGHRFNVQHIIRDYRTRFILTADTVNTVNIWDRQTFSDKVIFPICTICNPFKELENSSKDGGDKSGPPGISAVGLSSCAKYVIICSQGRGCTIKIYLWSFGREEADDAIALPDKCGRVLEAKFSRNLKDSSLFVLTMTNGVVFGSWDGLNKMMKVHFPERGYSRDLIFSFLVGNTTKAISVTKTGGCYMWMNDENDATYQKEYVKSLSLHPNGIAYMTSIDDILVVGDGIGDIFFYDEDLKLLFYINDMKLGKIKTISFNSRPRKYVLVSAGKTINKANVDPDTEIIYTNKVPRDITSDQNPFVIRNFVAATEHGIKCVDFLTKKTKPLLHNMRGNMNAFSVHPTQPLLCGSDSAGRLFYYDYKTKQMTVSALLPEQKIVDAESDKTFTIQTKVCCLKFSPCGNHLLCGTENGAIFVLDPVILAPRDSKPLLFTTKRIVEMVFSEDSVFLAYSDINYTIVLLYFDKEWKIIGKHRVHRNRICSLMFVSNGSLYPRLITISEFRLFVEYDVRASFVQQQLVAIKTEYLNFMIKPKSAIDYSTDNQGNTMILIADEEMKFKLIDSVTLEIQNQFLAPLFDGPILKMLTLNENFLVLVTEKTVCLYLLPVNGNPFRYLGIYCNPVKLDVVEINGNKDMLFSLADNSSSIIMWRIHTETVYKELERGGSDLQPYCCLLPGGKHGWFFKEILDMFYFVQILASDEDGIAKIKETISLSAIPDFMRSIGFYPSEAEINLMLSPFKREGVTEISFDELIILYINHRPVNGIKISDVATSMLSLCTPTPIFCEEDDYEKLPVLMKRWRLDMSKVMHVMCEMGDKMDPKLAKLYLKGLYCSADEKPSDADIPESFTLDEFIKEILGIGNRAEVIKAVPHHM